MDESYRRKREFFGAVSGRFRVRASSTGLIPLVPAILKHTIFLQQVHLEVTAPIGGAIWTVQDAAGTPFRSISAGAVAHFDYDFGADGVPCAEATDLDLNVTGTIGAVGWITWEAYKRLTQATP